MNKVILMGRLTRDPEIRYSQNDSSMRVARFTLAVDRRFKRDNEATADFIGCVAFGRTAEFLERFFRQGSKIVVEGRIQTGSYTKQDGTKVYTTDVVVENAEFAESKAAANGTQGVQQQYQQEPANNGFGNQPSYGGQMPGAGGYQPQAVNHNDYFEQPASAPMQEAADEGFMQIPDTLEDEGLPFN